MIKQTNAARKFGEILSSERTGTRSPLETGSTVKEGVSEAVFEGARRRRNGRWSEAEHVGGAEFWKRDKEGARC